jgi:hypothetical protein
MPIEAFLVYCGLPLLLCTALVILVTRLRFRLEYDYTGWVLAGAIGGGAALFIAMNLMQALFRPELAEFDILINLFLPPVGSVVGAGTVLMIALLRRNERVIPLTVLALLSIGAFLPATGLVDVFRLPEQYLSTTGTAAYWLGVFGLPVLWVAGLWLAWLLRLLRGGGKSVASDANGPDRYGELGEDVSDILLARERENKPRESLEDVRQILTADGKLDE